MADEKEVLRYHIDITDAEIKSQRLQQLLEEIKAKRGSGQDTSALEAQFHKVADALGRMAGAQKKVGGVTDDLVRQKEKLANVVTLVGGRFGGLVGNLGNVVELMIRGGQAAIGFGAALAVFTGATMIFARLASDARRAEQAIRQVTQAQREAARVSIGTQTEVADALAGAGVLGKAAAGRGTAEKLMRSGVERELAIFGAVAQQVGGLAPEQVEPAVGAWVLRGREGAFGLDQAANQKLIQQLLAVDREQAMAALGARKADIGLSQVPPVASGDVARETAAAADRLEKKTLTEREREVGMALAGGEDPIRFRTWLDWFFRGSAPDMPAGLSRAQASTYQAARRRFIMAGVPSGDATRTMADLLDMGLGAREDAREAAPTTQPVYIGPVYNAGHIQMGPDNRNNRHMVRMGVSKQDHRKPP